MIQLSYTYNHDSARLMVSGLPDISQDHSPETIGVLSSWKLQLIGVTELEGKRSHLESLISTVLPYARYTLSGIKREFGEVNNPVKISPSEGKHLITLNSSQKGVGPLELKLDHAELADLVRCLDDMLMDQRVQVDWKMPPNKALPSREISKNLFNAGKLITPLIGITSFVFISIVLLLIPIPQSNNTTINLPEEISKDN